MEPQKIRVPAPMTRGPASGEGRRMSESPHSERERDLMREIVELVGGSRLRLREPDRPSESLVEPAPEELTPRAPADEEDVP